MFLQAHRHLFIIIICFVALSSVNIALGICFGAVYLYVFFCHRKTIDSIDSYTNSGLIWSCWVKPCTSLNWPRGGQWCCVRTEWCWCFFVFFSITNDLGIWKSYSSNPHMESEIICKGCCVVLCLETMCHTLHYLTAAHYMDNSNDPWP